MSIFARAPQYLAAETRRLRNSPLAHNAGWMMAGQGMGLFLQAVNFIVLARLLTRVEYGIFAGAFAFTGLVSQYSALGTGTVFIRYVSVDHGKFAVYWGNILLAVLGMSGLMVMVMPFLGKHTLNPASASLVLISTMANCICGPLITEIARIYQAYETMRITATLNLLTQAMRTIAAVVLFVTIHHATAWQWASVSLAVSAIAATIAVVSVIVRFGWPRFSSQLFAKHGVEGVNYAFAASTSAIYNDVDKTMLSHYGMNAANGVYSLAYRVIDIATIPIFSIRDAALPRLFQSGHAGILSASELANRLLKRSLIYTAIAAVGILLLSPLIPLIVGREFAETAAVLRWLCLIPFFRAIHLMTGAALTGAGFQRYRTAGQLVAALFNFGINLWLIPYFGWLGAAWSSLATDGALGMFNYAAVRFLVSKSRAAKPLPEQV